MTRLFLVTEDGRKLWVAALIDEDVWTYVGNTGKFHRNEGIREDYFVDNRAEYAEIGITEAKRLIAAGVGTIADGEAPDALADWREDRQAMDADVVFATLTADLA